MAWDKRLAMIFEKVVTRMVTPKQGSTSYDFYTTETLVQKGKRSLKRQSG